MVRDDGRNRVMDSELAGLKPRDMLVARDFSILLHLSWASLCTWLLSSQYVGEK